MDKKQTQVSPMISSDMDIHKIISDSKKSVTELIELPKDLNKTELRTDFKKFTLPIDQEKSFISHMQLDKKTTINPEVQKTILKLDKKKTNSGMYL